MPLSPQPDLQPTPHLSHPTFLAPSFSAFFLASSKSSFWPMLACGAKTEASKPRAERVQEDSEAPG